jgi:general secretion pathway protein K
MALLLVISMIALLSVVIIRFSRSMQLAVTETSHFQQSVLMESMAQSGLDIGLAVLQQDARLSEEDSFLEYWARLGETPLDVGIGQGEVSVVIIDLDGRFPINSLVEMVAEGDNPWTRENGMTPQQARDILLRLLQSGLFVVEDETTAREVVESLTDWVDADDEELEYGAEAGYYNSLENPVVPRNGAVDFIDELLQVRGISKDLLYGNSEKEPLIDYISVENKSGKININTAPLALIQALDERINADQIEGLDEFRRDEDNLEALSDSSWFIDFLPGDIDSPDLRGILSSQSSHFIIDSEARYQERFSALQATVERSSENEMRLVFLEVE